MVFSHLLSHDDIKMSITSKIQFFFFPLGDVCQKIKAIAKYSIQNI